MIGEKQKFHRFLSPKYDTNPINYRGISLLSCVSKLYSAIIESRIINCDYAGLIADKMVFRKDRSCTDHKNYVLTTIIKINSRNDVFCAFIDMEKAFDWINRKFQKLLELVQYRNGKSM